ncbi:F-box only protein 34 isoform 1-T2 [Pholidichthys leucotaenia]
MHLKSCPELVRSELRVDVASSQQMQRSSLFVRQQGALLRTYTTNNGSSSSCLPFSVISTNTLCCTNATNSTSGTTWLRLKTPPNTTSQNALQNCDNIPKLDHTTTDDISTQLDIWSVIKPGHVREKIAIIVSEWGQTDGSSSNCQDRVPLVSVHHGATVGPSRAVKVKGSWEEISMAKRRRRSGQDFYLRQDQRTQNGLRPSPQHPELTQQSDGPVTVEEVEPKMSVVEMVALLEQRLGEQRTDFKPLLTIQRSSTTVTLSRALSSEGSKGEGLKNITVSDMVARLESECLRRRADGNVSRSNSLRRTVGRVLLAANNQSSVPCQPSSVSSAPTSLSSSLVSGTQSREPASCPPASAVTTPPSSPLTTLQSGEQGSREAGDQDSVVTETKTEASPEEVEPLPGLLFLCPSKDEKLQHKYTEPCPHRCRATFDLTPTPHTAASSFFSESDNQSKKSGAEVVGPISSGSSLVRRVSASQDFLEKRQRLQQLLEPQSYLLVLPHHLLVKIFLLLPTQSLAALKCSCSYFKFIIENYGVRPADSLWVSYPQYRDDPCKQCKKRYNRGDVSLCRWHHKPYCQALPYGPGFWMCCLGTHRDTPGCNVGLHDNRWVPAFHSISAPVYKQTSNDG